MESEKIRALREQFEVPKGRPLADFLPTMSINAKALAADITKFHVEQKELFGESPITEEHVTSNVEVRKFLVKQGIIPENLPPAEDIRNKYTKKGHFFGYGI